MTAATLGAFEWKPQETAENHPQDVLRLIGAVPDFQLVPTSVIHRATFNGCLNEAARHSGMDDYQIADEIHLSHGYMSKFMRCVAQQWAKRLIAFMRTTRSYAPVQWIADQMGGDFVPRSSQEARIKELEAQLAAARHR